MLDMYLALRDWLGGMVGAVRRFWDRVSGAERPSTEPDGRVSARMRTHGMTSKSTREGDR